MKPETLATLFQPYQQADSSTTRRFGGTGLGLMITKQIVQGMGGNINVTSEFGRGSTFSWYSSSCSFRPSLSLAGRWSSR